MRRAGDLLLVAALAAACALVCAVAGDGAEAVRVLPAAMLVLVLPGYALTAALLAPGAIAGVERFVLTIALSIVASVITALMLNLLWSLETTSWAVGLAVATALAALVAGRRGNGRPLRRPPAPAPGLGAVLALAGAVVLAGGAFALGLTPLRAPDDAQGTTALWISPRGENAVTIGVRSIELERWRYELDVRVAGQRTRRIGPFVLDPGQERLELVPAPRLAVGRPVVEAVLHRLDGRAQQVRRVALRSGRRSLVVKPVPRPRCPRSHPLRSARGCYRVVVRDGRRLRYYRSGRKVPVA